MTPSRVGLFTDQLHTLNSLSIEFKKRVFITASLFQTSILFTRRITFTLPPILWAYVAGDQLLYQYQYYWWYSRPIDRGIETGFHAPTIAKGPTGTWFLQSAVRELSTLFYTIKIHILQTIPT